jgi:hypothetical protein
MPDDDRDSVYIPGLRRRIMKPSAVFYRGYQVGDHVFVIIRFDSIIEGHVIGHDGGGKLKIAVCRRYTLHGTVDVLDREETAWPGWTARADGHEVRNDGGYLSVKKVQP